MSLESKVIRGKLTNCVIEETVMIGPDVEMEDCIIMNGTVIQGPATYKNCIFGVGCQKINDSDVREVHVNKLYQKRKSQTIEK